MLGETTSSMKSRKNLIERRKIKRRRIETTGGLESGQLEQEIIEISWLIKGAEAVTDRVRLSRNPANENFVEIVNLVEQTAGQRFDGLRVTFSNLSYDRNLIVHGSWLMVDDRPYVVWHKFLEDTDSVMGEYYVSAEFAGLEPKTTAIGSCSTEA
jgi:hypothetical protein